MFLYVCGEKKFVLQGRCLFCQYAVHLIGTFPNKGEVVLLLDICIIECSLSS